MKKINALKAAISAAGCFAIAGCASGGAARTAAQEMRFEYPQDSQHFSENDGAITFSLDVPSGNYDVVIDSDASTVISERIGGIEAAAGIKKEGKSFKVAVCDGVLDLSFSEPAHVKSVRIKAGFYDGKVVDADTVVALSKIPPKEVLISKMLGSFNSPITSLVIALDAIREKNEQLAG